MFPDGYKCCSRKYDERIGSPKLYYAQTCHNICKAYIVQKYSSPFIPKTFQEDNNCQKILFAWLVGVTS